MPANLLISLADFAEFVPFSPNISEALVAPHIRDAQTFDVLPLLPTAVQATFTGDKTAWQPADTAFFTAYLRPLLVLEAARRLLLWHGTHVTPAGLEDLASDVNRTPASQQRRTTLSADLQGKCSHYRARLEGALRTYSPPAAAANCAGPTRYRSQPGGLEMFAL